jgi:hypothetical protein
LEAYKVKELVSSKFAFKRNLYRYTPASFAPGGAGTRTVGLYKFNSVDP